MKKISNNKSQFKDKNVLVRVDSDVVIKDGQVLDDERLQASIPTIKYLLENGAKVTIIGHLGRPKGKEVAELKMRPIEDKFIEFLGTHQNWQILENLRFNAGEEENDPQFVKQLVTGQDFFVQDAFATCHREHASIVGVAGFLPSFAGFSVIKEAENLDRILESPSDGFTIIIGGKKALDKLPVIENLMSKAENFLIGGVVADTFLAAEGYSLGKSLVEKEVFDATKAIKDKFSKNKKNLLLPDDLVFSKSIEKSEETKTLPIDNLEDIADFYAVDIGPKTSDKYCRIIKDSKTIFWNGNMGVTEVDDFDRGTMKIAEAIANSSAKKYAGGGDTTAFIRLAGIAQNFDFISTAGGATLEYLAGKKLPGLEVLN